VSQSVSSGRCTNNSCGEPGKPGGAGGPGEEEAEEVAVVVVEEMAAVVEDEDEEEEDDEEDDDEEEREEEDEENEEETEVTGSGGSLVKLVSRKSVTLVTTPMTNPCNTLFILAHTASPTLRISRKHTVLQQMWHAPTPLVVDHARSLERNSFLLGLHLKTSRLSLQLA